MPHLAITVFLKSAFRKAVADIETTVPVTKSTQNSRRRFLQDAGIIGAGMMMLPSFLQAADFNSNKKITIIGAGIAGLNAAYQLQKLGLQSTLYEAGKRTGGRMYTMKNYFGDNITTDIGGEFVDTNHEEIIELVKELQLDFYDLRTEQLTNQNDLF
ncbi:FAD-dependent oxidoreductase [Ferruginibacter sp.]|uniref:FAD-dependent oxidoreductase n=1 Tax=Ferruginibacter sp. TaxID=1940288 RepID=UPI0019C1140C|nr:FAD-dependent oxidoreductase [Ferruginibacter sp.]MBC7627873.1 NAD(P)-binding protein [Ferruginibacter sp.]